MVTLAFNPSWMRRQHIPPLENGDRLTRAQFEQRWQAMPHVKRAELIEGVVHMAAALRWDQHGQPHVQAATWLGTYLSLTPGLTAADNASVYLDDENIPQPDLALRIPESAGGQSRIDDQGFLAGPPEMIVEIAASSSSIDLHAKLDVYRNAGVHEYLVWRTLDEAFDWFALRDSRYERLDAEQGILKSRQFPGLWLDTAAMLRGDLAGVLETLRRACRGPAHEALVKKLAIPGR